MIDCIRSQSHKKTQKHIMHCQLQLRKMFTGTNCLCIFPSVINYDFGVRSSTICGRIAETRDGRLAELTKFQKLAVAMASGSGGIIPATASTRGGFGRIPLQSKKNDVVTRTP